MLLYRFQVTRETNSLLACQMCESTKVMVSCSLCCVHIAEPSLLSRVTAAEGTWLVHLQLCLVYLLQRHTIILPCLLG